MIKNYLLVIIFSLMYASFVEPYNLQIIATTNNNGEMEPCG